MRKKTLSLALALVMCLGLTVPAFAVDLSGAQLYPAGDWGNGPTLTLKGVVGERETPNLELSHCYDVAVGGSLVLDMPYPAGKNRDYVIMPAYTAVKPNFEPAEQEPGDVVDPEGLDNWDIPKSFDGGVFEASSGKSQYVYNFTEADMARGDGYEKIIYMHIGWEESVDGSNYSSDSGAVYFYIHVVPAQPAGKIANPSNDKLTVNGVEGTPTVYNIDDSNYFKIRDVAALLNGTEKQFSVGYDAEKQSVTATTGQGYDKLPTDLAGAPAGAGEAKASADAIYVNGAKITPTVYNINGNNYFKLRDLGEALDFYIGWTLERGVYIETDKPYAG